MYHQNNFRRTSQATAYCDALFGKGIVDAKSGLFLAGPRRVGKTTFLIEDLIPEAKTRQWTTVYVDLWADKRCDPAILITESIKTSIAASKSKIRKLIKKIPVNKINVLKTVELDFSKPGLPNNITLTDLLNHLVHLQKKPVLLVIDEAQHALTTDHGVNAMFAIKSARDQINTSFEAPNLMLVLTGSNRDKLAQLVIKKDQPFFGSQITTFPLLQKDFTNFLTDHINQALSSHNQFSKKSMWEAFQLTGHRPEVLLQLVGKVAIHQDAKSFSDLLAQDASLWHTQIWDEYEHDFISLTPLQKAILSLLIQAEKPWSPFSETSMQYYKNACGMQTLSISTVQTAIQSLREQEFIWQSSRGSYALEDDGFAVWYKRRHLITDHSVG